MMGSAKEKGIHCEKEWQNNMQIKLLIFTNIKIV